MKCELDKIIKMDETSRSIFFKIQDSQPLRSSRVGETELKGNKWKQVDKIKKNCKWSQKGKKCINGYNIMNWCDRDGKETRTF